MKYALDINNPSILAILVQDELISSSIFIYSIKT